MPAAAVLVAAGFLSCFAGYRLFRIVLGIFGFILGAMITTSTMGTSSHFALGVAAVVGGLVGVALMFVAYYIGVALVGAGLAVAMLTYAWKPFHGEPVWWIVGGVAIVGALIALALTRYVLIVGTAFGGAWTLIVGALALMGDHAAAEAASQGNIWVMYPLEPSAGRWWINILWLVVSACGIVAQLATTSKGGGSARKK